MYVILTLGRFEVVFTLGKRFAWLHDLPAGEASVTPL
jgi:hypothetical protein